MPFSGKATYTAGSTLPELMEDVSDLVSLVSPYETPLLDALGDAGKEAQSTLHEWIEDELLPNIDTINQTTFTPSATTATAIIVGNIGRFRVGDLVRPPIGRKLMLVTAINTGTSTMTVTRAYGGTTAVSLSNTMKLTIIGNAALEGDDRPDPRSTNRLRKRNYTQIFTAAVEVSGSMLAARRHGAGDELDMQKANRLRELLRDLENTAINGVSSIANPQGNASTRRTMGGIIANINSGNQFTVNTGAIPAGSGAGNTDLNEAVLNAAMRQVWENSSAQLDIIVVPAALKRRINNFYASARQAPVTQKSFTDLIDVYQSDFGTARIIVSRWMPADTMLLLDSSRIELLPLAGRTLGYKPQASTGDRDSGLIVGEYTLEMRNDTAHGLVRGLT